MESLKNFLELKELGTYLVGRYAEAFHDVFSFISYVAVVLFVVWMLQWVSPFRQFIKAIQQEMLEPFEESHLIKELIPNGRFRLRFYRILMWGGVFSMAMCYLGSFYYGSAAIASLLAENLEINRYTTFTFLSGLAVLMFLLGSYYLKETNRLAKFLNESRA